MRFSPVKALSQSLKMVFETSMILLATRTLKFLIELVVLGN